MADPAIVHDSASIVVRGHFNPAIFSPAWLLSEELISEPDYEDSQAELVSADVTVIKGPGIECQVTREALQLSGTRAETFEVARDLVVGILRTLRHTPVAVVGINRNVHISIEDETAYNRVGDTIAPKGLWDSLLPLAGMQSISLIGATSFLQPSRCLLRIEQSAVVSVGIFIQHNDHFTLLSDSIASLPESKFDIRPDPEESTAGTEKLTRAVNILQSNWQESMARAEKTVSRVLRISHHGAN